MDPGFGPGAIVEAAGRSGRYLSDKVGQLAFAGAPPDAAELSRTWHRMLAEAEPTIAVLPPEEAGTCVLDSRGELLGARPESLATALQAGRAIFHRGRSRGAMPRLVTID